VVITFYTPLLCTTLVDERDLFKATGHEAKDMMSEKMVGLVNLIRCGWAFCPSHFAPTVKWGSPRNAKLRKH